MLVGTHDGWLSICSRRRLEILGFDGTKKFETDDYNCFDTSESLKHNE